MIKDETDRPSSAAARSKAIFIPGTTRKLRGADRSILMISYAVRDCMRRWTRKQAGPLDVTASTPALTTTDP